VNVLVEFEKKQITCNSNIGKHMKLKNLIKSLEKASLKIEQNRNGQYYCMSENRVCSFYKNGGDSDQAICVNIRRKNDHHDFNSDYHAGFFVDTIKDAVRYMIEK
jgi:hypothetical protein